ncbi:1-(5-phosphoribosyl)-5-[(5-phosphoribosylamino)methylideneamino]imidazole-4-carboxamide isomerase [Ethanoligenens sp.]|uniref:1-(5-phosphoribosyl)-5-[(5- phosphoribosylamino)methylideneamino]imidazole-4- carboxamide isomerase n=1 Tax=Ethanoligenens sp. TaxID=2099655 RepID=UPI0039ED42D0
MILFPAIDIKNGTCVRLKKGDFGTAEKVAENPFDTAARFRQAGAHYLHMVDLDGAKTGERPNRDLILKIVRESGMRTELGGGIRDMACVEDYLEHGIDRVILGSAALKDPQFLKEAVHAFGERIAVGIDAKNGFVATQGWLETSTVSYLTFAKTIESIGVKYIIFTDIDRDGMLGGPNFEQLAELQKNTSCQITASGGIRDVGHIQKLKQMGLYGAICGKSIYSGTLDLAQAVKIGGNQYVG